MFFLRILLVCVTAIISRFVVGVAAQLTLGSAGSPSFLSILGTHLLFNVKEAGERGIYPGTSHGSKSTMSDIAFDRRCEKNRFLRHKSNLTTQPLHI